VGLVASKGWGAGFDWVCVMVRMGWVVVLVALVGVLAGCRAGVESEPAVSEEPGAGTVVAPQDEEVSPEEVLPAEVAPLPVWVELGEAFGGREFDRPVEVVGVPSLTGVSSDGVGDDAAADAAGSSSVLVAEQDGVVLQLGGVEAEEPAVVLDIRDRVYQHDAPTLSERGLLSVQPDPGFAANGQLWVFYSPQDDLRMRLSRFSIELEGEQLRGDAESELVVLEVPQPFVNHNGGAIRFGPDGMLYLGLGDGGGAGDPEGHGQRTDTLLGTVIRLDVSGASEEERYVVPADNPFLGDEGVRDEIWAYGLRNPWRMAFDPESGGLWVGHVGQDRKESIYLLHGGENLGWNVVEGWRCFDPPEECDAEAFAKPVYTYPLEDGHCAVIGGVVYEGERAPELRGAYLFSDFCSGELRALFPDELMSEEGVESLVVAADLGSVTSLGVDADGELYVVRFFEPILTLAE